MAVPMPPFTSEHEELRATVRGYVEAELAPHADAWEAAKWFPNAVFAGLADQGWLGLKYPEEYGGRDAGYLADAVFAEELARCRSGGVAAGIGAHTSIATPPVWKFGTDEQKQHYLAPAVRGERIGALAITEPDAGSDVAAVRTRAERVDGGWLVRGAKTYITNGVRADFYVTAVRTSAAGGHHGMSFLLVDRGEGVDARALDKLGWHASDTAEIAFDDVFVPEEHLLGGLDEGFKLIMANFQWERLLMALGAVGGMTAAFEQTVRFARERVAFGRPLARQQAVGHRLADLETTIAASRAITYDALRRFVAGVDATREVTMAKLSTQRAAVEVIDACLQVHGAAGYLSAPGVERALRDARLGPIGGGTDEVMREILARTLP